MGELHIKLGKLLRIERERQQVEISTLSDELKISVENLEAIETGDVEKLPSELYFNLFAKSYAEYLGIDFTRTVDAIREDFAETEESEAAADTDESEADDEKPPKKAAVTAGSLIGKRLITLVVIVIIMFAAFQTVYRLLIDDSGTGSEEETAVEPSTASAFPSDTEPLADEQYRNYDWNVPEHEEPSTLTLTLTARQESWATILGDGDTLVYRNLVPWREYHLEARYRFLVSVGIPSVVDILLNGNEVDLADPDTRRISRVAIDQANLASFLNRESVTVQSPPVTVAPMTADTANDQADINEETPAVVREEFQPVDSI